MRLFRRQSTPPPSPEWLVVGLGNPGPEYSGTRHNVGFRVVDRLAAGANSSWSRRDRQAATATATIADQSVLLVKPLTFMNLSGRAVNALARRHSLKPERVLVVYDDIDLPLGRLRIRANGSAGGHRGVKSLIECLQSSEFPRIRIGVGRPSEEAIDHVLGRFSREELPLVEEAIARAAQAVDTVLRDGVEAAMNRFNPA